MQGIQRIDFDVYPYIAYYLLHTLDSDCPIYAELKVPPGLGSRSSIIRHFKKTPINYLIEVAHVPFETDLFGVKGRLSTQKGEWYEDKSGQYVYVKLTATDQSTHIKDTRTYD